MLFNFYPNLMLNHSYFAQFGAQVAWQKNENVLSTLIDGKDFGQDGAKSLISNQFLIQKLAINLPSLM